MRHQTATVWPEISIGPGNWPDLVGHIYISLNRTMLLVVWHWCQILTTNSNNNKTRTTMIVVLFWFCLEIIQIIELFEFSSGMASVLWRVLWRPLIFATHQNVFHPGINWLDAGCSLSRLVCLTVIVNIVNKYLRISLSVMLTPWIDKRWHHRSLNPNSLQLCC